MMMNDSLPLHHQHLSTTTIATVRQHHPVHNCLLYDFHAVFSKGQSIAQNIQGGSIRLEGALLLSKRYKAAMKRAVKMLEQPQNNEGQTQTAVQQLGEELCSAVLLWSLVEAVSIRPSQNLISIDLLEWARECFPSAESQVPSAEESRLGENSFLGSIMEELMQQTQPELHDAYWNSVIRQALCADFPSVTTLLQFHSTFKRDDVLGRMVKILTAAEASLFNHDRSSADEFQGLQKKLRELATQKQLFRAHDNLGVICSLFIGDKGTFRKYFDLYRPNWFEVLPAYLLYFRPDVGGEQMPELIERMFAMLGLHPAQLSKLEQTVLAIMKLDLLGALKLICSAGKSICWFAAHLVDLLHFHDPTFLNPAHSSSMFGQQLDTAEHAVDLDLRARLLLEYGQLLFEDGQLWEIGADYVLASGVPNALELLDRLVAGLDWHDNAGMADSLLTMCERHELHAAREDILRAVAMKFCRQGDWSTALHWALRMQTGNDLVAQMARRILEGAIPPERIGQMRCFDAMADQWMDCAELVLLYKFHIFKQRLEEGDLRQAMQLLHELFLDNSSPTEFHVAICQELVRILVTFQRAPVLDAADTLLEQQDKEPEIPGLDRKSVQSMLRALSMFQMQQQLRKAAALREQQELQQQQKQKQQRNNIAAAARKGGQTHQTIGGGGIVGGKLFPPAEPTGAEVYERLDALMRTLRPLLAEALASAALAEQTAIMF